MIGNFIDQGLLLRSTPSQLKKTNPVLDEIHFTTYQTVQPLGINQKRVTQKKNIPSLSSSTQKNHGSLGRLRQIQGPMFWKRTSQRSGFSVNGSANPVSSYIVSRLSLECCQRWMMKTSPDFGLPPTIIVFDGRLKSTLSRRNKDRNHSQAEAHSDHRTNDVLMLVRSLKDGIVVKLDIGRQSHLLPVLTKTPSHLDGIHGFTDKSDGQSSPERYPIQYFHQRTIFDFQSLYNIKLIQISSFFSNLRKIPARGGAGWRSCFFLSMTP